MANDKNYPYVAFFDVDHTIINVNSGKILAQYAHQSGLMGKHKILIGVMFSLLYKMKLVKPERMIKRMLSWFAGIEEKKVIEMTEDIFRTHLKPAIREQIVKELRLHRQHGGQTVILSAAVSYICRPIKSFLQMDEMICTYLEVIKGRLSGKSKGAYCYGQEKLSQAQRFCHENGYHLDHAYFYADSMADYAVLTEVGHPVCVDPEKRLRQIAAQRGWRIMD